MTHHAMMYYSPAAITPAARCAIAMIVSIGFTPDEVGKVLASATYRPGTPQTAWSGLTTDVRAFAPIRHDAIWWNVASWVWFGPKPARSSASLQAACGAAVPSGR